MKKIVIGVLALAAIGAGALLFAGRMHAKTAHEGMLQGLTEARSVSVVDQRFEPGWLRSNSEVSFSVVPNTPMPGTGDVPHVGFRMRNEIDHGPVPMFGWIRSGLGGSAVVARVDTVFELDAETREEYFGDVDVPAIEAQTVVRASGVGETSVRIEPRQFQGENGLQVRWKGLEGNLVFTEDFDKLAGRFHSGGMEGAGDAVEFAVNEIEWALDYTTHASGLPLANLKLTLQNASFGQAGAPPLASATDLEVWQRTLAVGSNIEMALGQRIAELQFMGESFGPGELEFRASNFDASTLVEFREARAQLQGQGSEAQMQLVARSTELVQKLMAHSPKLEISKLQVVTPSGEVRGRARLAVDGSQPEMLGNPMTLAMAVTAEVDADLPAEVFGDLIQTYAAKQLQGDSATPLQVGENRADTVAYLRDTTIASLRKRGLVVFDGERYRTKWVWNKGQLNVNGLPMDPMQTIAEGLGGGPEESAGLSFPEQGVPEFSGAGSGFPASRP